MSSSSTHKESRARQNFHPEAEAAISAQITVELNASYVYLAMSSFFERDNVALPGLHKFYQKMSHDEREHALKLIEFMAKRGGIVHYEAIPKPPEYATETTTALGILQASLDLEHTVNAKLLKLHQLAEEHEDAQLEDFLEQHFLDEQVESIKQIADLVTQLERAGPEGLGLFLFDQRMPEAL